MIKHEKNKNQVAKVNMYSLNSQKKQQQQNKNP